VFAAWRKKREKGNFVLRAAKRIQNLPVGYDSEDEAREGMGGLGPNLNGGEEDDYGEEASSWQRVLKNAKGWAKWVGDVEMGPVIMRHDGDVQVTLELDGGTRFTRIRDGANGDADVEMDDRGVDVARGTPIALAPDARGLDDIDKSLLAERTDEDDMGDDGSDGGSGEDSDVDMD
jgi:hypothetical protein